MAKQEYIAFLETLINSQAILWPSYQKLLEDLSGLFGKEAAEECNRAIMNLSALGYDGRHEVESRTSAIIVSCLLLLKYLEDEE